MPSNLPDIDFADSIVSLISFKVSLLLIVDKILFKCPAMIVTSSIRGLTLEISCFDK